MRAPKEFSFLEILIDNVLGEPKEFLSLLDRLRQDYDFVFHGVGMNLGSVDPLDLDYLKKVRQLIERYRPLVVSEHLAWVGAHGRFHHDLLPLPYNEECLAHLSERILQVTDRLGFGLAIENPSAYVELSDSKMTEAAFINLLLKKTGAQLLLDVNNLYLSSQNFAYCPYEYLDSLEVKSIAYCHLAGHERFDSLLFDSHSGPAISEVLRLYEKVQKKMGQTAAILEWDNDLCDFARLREESLKLLSYLAPCSRRVINES